MKISQVKQEYQLQEWSGMLRERKEDLSRLPVRIEKHELTKEQLQAIYGENGWKRLPDEVYSRVEYQPAVKEVVEHHAAVYAAKKNDADKKH